MQLIQLLFIITFIKNKMFIFTNISVCKKFFSSLNLILLFRGKNGAFGGLELREIYLKLFKTLII